MALEVGVSVQVANTYISAHIHVVCALSISPHHAIRGEHIAHARGLPCEDDSAILGRGCEVGPRDGGRVAHDLRAFDEVLEGLRSLEARESREAVRGYQVHMGKEVIRHLRTRVGGMVGLVHAVHDGGDTATGLPRRSGRFGW